MTERKELRSLFINFDYNEDTMHSSRIKQAILYYVRIQKVFDPLGELELTPDIISFVSEPNIRLKLEDIVEKRSKFDLHSPELPFLMRTELVDAYFQYKISQHLQQFDAIEIFFQEGVRRLFSKPIGTELIARMDSLMRRKKLTLGDDFKERVRKMLTEGADYGLYNLVFDEDFGGSSIISFFQSQAGAEITGALAQRVFGALAVSDFGGKEAIDTALFFHQMQASQPASEKEKAIYNDNMRRILQVNGGFPETGRYNGIKLSIDRYNGLSPGYRRLIHHYLMENLMDAQKIREVATLFPGQIDESIALSSFVSFLEVAHDGIRVEGDIHFFNNDKTKDLEKVAMGAQYLLNQFAKQGGTALAVVDRQSASDKRRSGRNIGWLGLFGSFAEDMMYDEAELDEMVDSNAFEYYGITDHLEQEKLYQSFVRLFGDKGFDGRTAEENWVKARMKLKSDGSMQMAIIDDMYGDPENPEWFDPFEYSKGTDKAVDYFRRTNFEPNLGRLKEALDREIRANELVKNQLSIETNGECPIKVDGGVYSQATLLPHSIENLAAWDERIVALVPFVEQDYSAQCEKLGIHELKDKLQVKKAYHQAVARNQAHPDQTQDTQEKIKRASLLNELIRAKDELLHKLDLQSVGSSGVSIYLGNISAMLTD